MALTAERLFSASVHSDLVHLPVERKCHVINTFWPHLNLTQEAYIEEDYADLFELIGKTLRILYQHELRFADRFLDSLLATVTELKTHQASTKEVLANEVKKTYHNVSDDCIMRSVELAARLWLGLNISSRHLSVGPKNPRDSRIEWHNNQSLNQVVATTFRQKFLRAVDDEYSLDDSFTAVSLKAICRVRIRWTDNLVDHLKLEGPRGHRILSIYRHKICLINHLKGPDPTVIERDVLDEAIRTLDLLFPFGDLKSAEFLEAERVRFHSMPPSELSQPMNLAEFTYWRNNLAQLLRLLNGPPETIAQTLLDRRNLSQFATLWVAIFGVFSLTILFGILATVYSIKQYRVAVMSYDLALALACHEIPALPGFC
ncbi:Nn.00g080110.m01.CDS01 [Neocucurbitaria sp. VM-36]